MPLFQELMPVHRAIFAETFTQLQWFMVANFECSMARRGAEVCIKETTFWMSASRDVQSKCTLIFCDPKDKELQ